MLARLLVQNYALIDQLEVHFSEGLSVLTGETGAGKSLLVGAIGLVLGRRADTAVLLDTTRKCLVEAEVEGSLPPEIFTLLHEEGLPQEPTLLLRREINPNGRSRAFVNDSPVTLEVLRAITERLIDLHGQDDDQLLLAPTEQLRLLDAYAGCTEQTAAFGEGLAKLKAIRQEAAALRDRKAHAQQEADFLRFQLDELATANLSADEEAAIEAEFKRQQHAEQIAAALGSWNSLLEDDTHGLLTRLASLLAEGRKLQGLDDRLAGPLGVLTEAEVLLIDATASLRDLAEVTERDPQRLAELEARLDTYNRLKLKYKATDATELIAKQTELQTQYNSLEAADDRLEALESEAAALATSLTKQALALEAARQQAADALSPAVTAVLHAVGLPKALFTVAIERVTASDDDDTASLAVEGGYCRASRTGIHRVVFQIATNPGLPGGPLGSVASGGERARVMLALKHALAKRVGLSTLIFDEIDTGISGEVALQVGRLLEELSRAHQLLTITHLPQIASRPGRHYFLYKEQATGTTHTRIRELTGKDRTHAIAVMLSGENPSASALASADELLQKRLA